MKGCTRDKSHHTVKAMRTIQLMENRKKETCLSLCHRTPYGQADYIDQQSWTYRNICKFSSLECGHFLSLKLTKGISHQPPGRCPHVLLCLYELLQ